MNYLLVTVCFLSCVATNQSIADSSRDPGASSTPEASNAASNSSSAPATSGSTTQSPDVNIITGKYGKIAIALLTPVASSGTSSDSTSSTPGLDYSFNWKSDQFSKGLTSIGNAYSAELTVALQGTGKYAFNTSTNVGSLINTSINAGLDVDHVIGGIAPPDARTCDVEKSPDCADINPFPGSWFGAFRFAPSASYEANQRFDDKQILYGVLAAGQAYPADTGESWQRLLDIADWPFKLTRWLSNQYSSGKNPWANYPSSWPAISAEFQRVNPTDDAARKVVDPSLRPYNRLHLTASMASLIGYLQGVDVRFLFKIDYWDEINPISAIKNAGLNAETYRAYAVEFQGHWTLSYTSGKVPLDYSSSKVWQIGYAISTK
jgi:hypothetical protein